MNRDILRGLTAKQFREWEHFAELEPFGEKRADYRAASIVQATFNVNRGKKQKAMTLEEAVVKFGEEAKETTKPKQTQKQQLDILTVLSKMQAYAVASGNDKIQG